MVLTRIEESSPVSYDRSVKKKLGISSNGIRLYNCNRGEFLCLVFGKVYVVSVVFEGAFYR